MTTSDIITLVSLIIAIIAILSEKNRKHQLLKFNIVDYALFSVAFVFINYFVFYDIFYYQKIRIHFLYFNDFGSQNPGNYAYLITIISLLYLFYKILFSFYPYSKLQLVIKFYKQLIESNETTFLLDLIDRYHKVDIINVIKRTDDYKVKDTLWKHKTYSKATIKKAKKLCRNASRFLMPYSWLNRRAYSVAVLHGIINDPAFIILASNQRPYLFTEIFAHFKKAKRKGFPNKLMNSFLFELIKHNNFWLIKELQQCQGNDFGQPEHFFHDNKILAALLKDLSVAHVNEVWRPFSDNAADEIEVERRNGYESKLFQEFSDSINLWDYRVYLFIQFFKILIIEVLVQKYPKSHFSLLYYRSNTARILITFDKFPPDNFEEVETVYHHFVDVMVNNCFVWVQVSNNNEDVGLYNDILNCLGSMIINICNSRYYCLQKKTEYIKEMFYQYCNLESNSQSEKMRLKIGEILLKPSNMINSGDIYYRILAAAWEEFDKMPYIGNEIEAIHFKHLQQQVISPLGLNIDDF